MNTFNPGVSGLVLVMVAIAAVSDLRSHRIPNWLIATGLLAALLLQVFEHGAGGGSRAWLTGALAGLAPFLVLYLAGAGGGPHAHQLARIGAGGGGKKARAFFGKGGVDNWRSCLTGSVPGDLPRGRRRRRRRQADG